MWDTVIGAGSLIVATVSSIFVYYSWKKQEIRHESVLNWSDEVISCLQGMVIYLKYFYETDSESDFIDEKIYETSILVERGRLFFKNQIVGDYGRSKPVAYRGYRPEILDKILISHNIALNWSNFSKEQRGFILPYLEDCVREFVSLAQQEVGRNKTACVETGRGGKNVSIEQILKDARERMH